ncbi:MAG: hypothetical protein AABW68_05165 [archaeon]
MSKSTTHHTGPGGGREGRGPRSPERRKMRIPPGLVTYASLISSQRNRESIPRVNVLLRPHADRIREMRTRVERMEEEERRGGIIQRGIEKGLQAHVNLLNAIREGLPHSFYPTLLGYLKVRIRIFNEGVRSKEILIQNLEMIAGERGIHPVTREGVDRIIRQTISDRDRLRFDIWEMRKIRQRAKLFLKELNAGNFDAIQFAEDMAWAAKKFVVRKG